MHPRFRWRRIYFYNRIGVIIGRYQNLRYAGGEVVASHLNARMSKIFVISGLHKIVKIEKEEDGSESGDEK